MCADILVLHALFAEAASGRRFLLTGNEIFLAPFDKMAADYPGYLPACVR
jgi:CHASE3 domain sensor protein